MEGYFPLMNMNRWPWAALVDVESSMPQAPWSSCLWILTIFASRTNTAAGAPTIISAFLEERDFPESHTTFLPPPHWPEPSRLAVPNCKVGWECSPLEECMAIWKEGRNRCLGSRVAASQKRPDHGSDKRLAKTSSQFQGY